MKIIVHNFHFPYSFYTYELSGVVSFIW